MKPPRLISESLQWDYKPHEIDILIPPVGLSTPLDGYLNPSSGIVNPPRWISETLLWDYNPHVWISESLQWNNKPSGKISESLQWDYKPHR